MWNEQHGNNIVIINCLATEIYFPEHWSPLSVKCTCNGRKYHHFRDKSLPVCDENFLILNEGAVYSSSIKAESLLKTEITVSELAKSVGFFDPSSFSKLFKRYYGQSPENYRERKWGIR